jgi:hypothetical protein
MKRVFELATPLRTARRGGLVQTGTEGISVNHWRSQCMRPRIAAFWPFRLVVTFAESLRKRALPNHLHQASLGASDRFRGADGKVVPPDQTELMAAALQTRKFRLDTSCSPANSLACARPRTTTRRRRGTVFQCDACPTFWVALLVERPKQYLYRKIYHRLMSETRTLLRLPGPFTDAHRPSRKTGR